MRSWKISFIVVWKVAGLLVRPKNMTTPSFIQTLLKLHRTSNLVKYLAPLSCVMSSEMRGRGYLFLMVMKLRAQ
jgi:hypothetical protein